MKNQFKSRFQEGWNTQNKLITYYYLFFFFVRGAYTRFRIKSAKGLLLVGKQVRLFYPKQLQVGYNTIIEDGAEINCLSQYGIQLGNRVTIGKYAIIRPSNIYGGPIGEGLIIGHHSNIGPYNYIGCSGKITIGSLGRSACSTRNVKSCSTPPPSLRKTQLGRGLASG